VNKATNNLLSGGVIGIAGALAGAALANRLARQRRSRSVAGPLPTQIAQALGDAPYDATYKVEWTVTGPAHLSADDTRIASRP
jgi:hypothetical protein